LSINHVRFFFQEHNQDQIKLIDHIDQVILDDKTKYQVYHLVMKEFFVLIFHIRKIFPGIEMIHFLDHLVVEFLLLIDDYY